MSIAPLSGLESVGSPPRPPEPVDGPQAAPAVAAAERVRQLQALLAEVERRQTGGVGGVSNNFASALDAAQAVAPGSVAPAAANPSVAAAAGGPYSAVASTASAYAPLIERAAARYGLEPSLLSGLIQQESGFDPSARSAAGALGLTQLMPSTAASLGVTEPLDPAQSIEGGARYLSQLLAQFGGNAVDALAAYNAGPSAVRQYGGVPPYPETQQYITKVLGYAASFRQRGELGAVPPALYSGGTGGVQIPAAGSIGSPPPPG